MYNYNSRLQVTNVCSSRGGNYLAFLGLSSYEIKQTFRQQARTVSFAQAFHERVPLREELPAVTVVGNLTWTQLHFRQQILSLSHSSLMRTGLISPPTIHLLTKTNFTGFTFSSNA